MSIAVELLNLSKSFPNVQANKDVSLTVKEGEIHALIGENGAGKSTLMNMLFGLIRPDSGNIRIFEKEEIIDSPKVAIELGLGMVHQHFKLVPSLTVAENIFLGQEITNKGLIDKEAQIEAVKELSKKFGLEVKPNAIIQNLSVGIQQRVEILKVLSRGTKILIMDEPTAVLTPQEADDLFDTLRYFVHEQGMTIIFISHHLNEIMEVSDNITVLRRGEVVAHLKPEECNQEELAALMVGKKINLTYNDKQKNPGEVVLETKNLWCRNDLGLPALRGIDLQVRAGEVVGIAGVAGNGQTELAEVMTGLRLPSYGEILLKGKNIERLSPRQIRDLGMTHVPSDRMTRGVDKEMSIEKNLLMYNQDKKPWCKNGLIQQNYLVEESNKLIKEFGIKAANGDVQVKTLSGGNIQKVVVAREFSQEGDFMLVDQPTRGIDIGSSKAVHDEILKRRDKGKAILLISVQLDEIMSISDRVLVLFEGQVVGEVDPRTITEEQIGLLMAGIKKEGVENSEA